MLKIGNESAGDWYESAYTDVYPQSSGNPSLRTIARQNAKAAGKRYHRAFWLGAARAYGAQG